MTVPSLLTYALRALVALAARQAPGPVRIAVIAKQQKVPARTLEQLFHRLKRKGLLKAERGPKGGYRLARPAEKISIHEVVEAIQPKGLFLGRRRAQGNRSAADPARGLWKQVEKAVQTALDAFTLETLVQQVHNDYNASIKPKRSVRTR